MNKVTQTSKLFFDLRTYLSADVNHYARLIWQKVFDNYRANDCSLERMDNLLIDYDYLKKYLSDYKDFTIYLHFDKSGLTSIKEYDAAHHTFYDYIAKISMFWGEKEVSNRFEIEFYKVECQ